jgi:hypothetical protein
MQTLFACVRMTGCAQTGLRDLVDIQFAAFISVEPVEFGGEKSFNSLHQTVPRFFYLPFHAFPIRAMAARH